MGLIEKFNHVLDARLGGISHGHEGVERQPPARRLFGQDVHRGPGPADEIDAAGPHVQQQTREFACVDRARHAQAIGAQEDHAMPVRDVGQPGFGPPALLAHLPERGAQRNHPSGSHLGQFRQRVGHEPRRNGDVGQIRRAGQMLAGAMNPSSKFFISIAFSGMKLSEKRPKRGFGFLT